MALGCVGGAGKGVETGCGVREALAGEASEGVGSGPGYRSIDRSRTAPCSPRLSGLL